MASLNNTSFTNKSSLDYGNCASEDSLGIMIVKVLAYCVVILLSFVGNVLVLHIFYKNRAIRTTTNSFIVNMAASDIMLPVFVIPRHMVAVFEKGPQALQVWRVDGFMGEVLCKFVPFIGDVSNSVSILTLVLISIDRYIAIVWPLSTKYRITPSRCNMLIAATWIMSLVLHAPYLYTFKLLFNGRTNLCILYWGSLTSMQEPNANHHLNDNAQKIYFVILTLLLYLIPLITITFLYSSIIHELRNKKRILSEQNQASHHRRQRRREDNRVIAMLVVIVSIFAVLFAPIYLSYFVLYFVWDYTALLSCGQLNLRFVLFFLTLSNCCLNPYIYFIFIRRYRQCAKNLLSSLCGSRIMTVCSKIRDWKCCFQDYFDDAMEDSHRTRRANSSCRARQTELVLLASEQEPTLQFETGV